LENIQLHRTLHGNTFQCGSTNKIHIIFKDIDIALNWYGFKALRNRMKGVKLEELLFDLSDQPDSLPVHTSEKHLVFTLCDFVQFKELIDGTMFTLELRSMLFEVLGEFQVQ
jgi:hypothetical protein